jgi:hypothetical protein
VIDVEDKGSAISLFPRKIDSQKDALLSNEINPTVLRMDTNAYKIDSIEKRLGGFELVRNRNDQKIYIIK